MQQQQSSKQVVCFAYGLYGYIQNIADRAKKGKTKLTVWQV